MNLEQEQWDMILGINPKIFNKQTGSMGFKYCTECKNMLEWYDNLWHCTKCS